MASASNDGWMLTGALAVAARLAAVRGDLDGAASHARGGIEAGLRSGAFSFAMDAALEAAKLCAARGDPDAAAGIHRGIAAALPTPHHVRVESVAHLRDLGQPAAQPLPPDPTLDVAALLQRAREVLA